MIWLTALEEDRAADAIVDKIQVLQIPVMQIFGVNRGGIPLAIKVSHRLEDLYDDDTHIPVIHREEEITDDTAIIEDIIHTGNTINGLLERLKKRGIRPLVICWVQRAEASCRANIALLEVSSGEPVKFPSETEKSALKSFQLSEQGR